MAVIRTVDLPSDAPFRCLIAEAADSILVTDTMGVIQSCNVSSERLLGYGTDEITGHNIQSLMLAPDDAYSGGDLSDGEVVGLRKDHTTFPMRLSATQGSLHGEKFLVNVLHDLTERKKADIEAKEFAARLRSILDTSPEAIVITDETGCIEMFSSAASRLFGYAADEVIGENVKLLMPQPYRSQHDGHLSRYSHTGENRVIGKGRIVVGQRRGGATFPMELSIGEVFGGDKRQFTGFMRDITECQHRLQELQGELLHVSRLSVMGQMTAALAHELNQPLTAITNYVIAANRTLGSVGDIQDRIVCAREMMDKAASQTLRAGAIVRSLGDFVKERESKHAPENLNRIVEEAVAIGFAGAAGANVNLRLDLDPTLPEVMIDRVQMQQVLINLIRNSIEAMETMAETQKRELVLSTTFEPPNAAVMTVADTGPGLPAEVSLHLFQPLITTKKRGMGLGLAICRSIVESHGGRIWLLPDTSQGTAFRIHLPLDNAGAAP